MSSSKLIRLAIVVSMILLPLGFLVYDANKVLGTVMIIPFLVLLLVGLVSVVWDFISSE